MYARCKAFHIIPSISAVFKVEFRQMKIKVYKAAGEEFSFYDLYKFMQT